MRNILTHIFEQIGQKALAKSRGYGSSLSSLSAIKECQVSDAAFAKLLKEIDSFSVEFTQQASEEVVSNKPIELQIMSDGKA